MGQLTQTTAEVQTAINRIEGEGWAQYVDGTYDVEGSALAITTQTQLPCDGTSGLTVTTYLPDGTAALWDTTLNKIISDTVGAAYDIRVEFQAKTSLATQPTFDVELDIGDPTPNIISGRTTSMPKGANTPVRYSIGIPIYSLATFAANGCKIFITPSGGTMSIWDIRVFVKRDFSPS